MAKDLIIGGASGYDWDKLKYWVNSIKQSGFNGDIVLAATNINKDTIQKLTDHGVKIYAYGDQDDQGNIVNQSRNAPHVERFLFIWDYLKNNKDKYRYVVVTDTRDVIFQRNPIEFLSSHLLNKSLVCSSEGLLYKDEPWGNKNLLDTFGSIIYNELKDNLIYNVGTIAGFYEEVTDFILNIFVMSINRPIPIVDQAVFNFLISHYPYKDEILKSTNESDWAIQLGTTKDAVESGAGDIGAIVQQNPKMIDEYLKLYQDIQPKLDGEAVTNGQVPYFIVHQWDRVPRIKQMVEKLYGE